MAAVARRKCDCCSGTATSFSRWVPGAMVSCKQGTLTDHIRVLLSPRRSLLQNKDDGIGTQCCPMETRTIPICSRFLRLPPVPVFARARHVQDPTRNSCGYLALTPSTYCRRHLRPRRTITFCWQGSAGACYPIIMLSCYTRMETALMHMNRQHGAEPASGTIARGLAGPRVTCHFLILQRMSV